MSFQRRDHIDRQEAQLEEEEPLAPLRVPGRRGALSDEALAARPGSFAPGRRGGTAALQLRRSGVRRRLRREEDAMRLAEEGLADSPQALPFVEVIQKSFGRHDVGGVRAHIGPMARQTNRSLGALAYAFGDAISFRDGAPDLRTVAHEAAHIIQQRAGAAAPGSLSRAGDPLERHADQVADRVVAGASAEPLLDRISGSVSSGGGTRAVQRFDEEDYEGLSPVEAVGEALDEDEEEDAFILMRRLSGGQATQVLNRYQSEATSCFGNDEIARATRILVGAGGNLARALEWMFDEGTDWSLLRGTIQACSNDAHKAALRTNYWKEQFIDELGNDEMSELVDLLGGDLEFKLTWMFGEGTDWSAIRSKIASAPAEERAALRTDGWKERFIGELGNDEMSELVDLLGGDIAFKLTWMFGEGTDWSAIKSKLTAAPDDEKAVLRTDAWRERFIGEVGNDEMSELVDLVGGDLSFKLEWMFAEGTDWELIKAKIVSAPGGEREVLRTDAWKERFIGELGNDEMSELVDLLGGDLAFKLNWMFGEGTDWEHIKPKITAAPDAERQALLTDGWRELFVGELGNDEMAELVALLGGPLSTQLQWMKAEGSDWEAMKGIIQAAPQADRVALYDDAGMREFFVSECDNESMAEAVGLLGGTLTQQLQWMAAEGSSGELVLAKVNAAPQSEREAIYDDATIFEMIQNFAGIDRIAILKVTGGPPEKQLEIFGDILPLSMITWATPSADWVDAVMSVRSSPMDLFDLAKKDPAGWAPHIRPKLWDLLKDHQGQLYGEERLAVFWAAFGNGASFNSNQCLHFFALVFGKPISPAGEVLIVDMGDKRKKYYTVAPDDATARELMNIVNPGGVGGGAPGLGPAEVATGQICFCDRHVKEEKVEDNWFSDDVWNVLYDEALPTSMYHGGYVIIKAIGGSMSTTTISTASDGTPTSVGLGLTYFQNHVRHEIGHAIGNKTFGDMSESGNSFATAYGGWAASSEAEFMGSMWSGQSEPSGGWPTIAIGATNVTATEDDVRQWCIGILSNGAEESNPIGNAPGTIQQKLTAIAGSLWGGERLVQYLRAVGANDPDAMRGRGYKFPGFTPSDPVQIYSTRYNNGFAKYSKAAHDAFMGISWYALSSPVEMFAEMYTARYSGLGIPGAVNGKDPNAFFNELEQQRDPMFGAPDPDPVVR